MAHNDKLPVSTSEHTSSSEYPGGYQSWNQRDTHAADNEHATTGVMQLESTEIPESVTLQVGGLLGKYGTPYSLAEAANIAIRMRWGVDAENLPTYLNVHFKSFLRTAFDELCIVKKVVDDRGSARGLEMMEALFMFEKTVREAREYYLEVTERNNIWHESNEHLVVKELRGLKEQLEEAIELAKSAPPPPSTSELQASLSYLLPRGCDLTAPDHPARESDHRATTSNRTASDTFGR